MFVMHLRILMIARHCGEVGSGGSRRPLLLAQGLQALGHHITVATPFADIAHPYVLHVPLSDPAEPDDALPERRASEAAFALPQRPAQGLLSLPRKLLPVSVMERARRWRYVPDLDIAWARRVEQAVLAERAGYDWVLTTSPPESLHAVGRDIARHVGGRWCADLRDGWIELSHRDYIHGARGKLEHFVAKQLLRDCNAVIAVNDAIAAEAHRLAGPAKPLLKLGHFSEPFHGEALTLSSTHFNLIHAGGFSLSHRTRNLPKIAARLTEIDVGRRSAGLAPLQLHIAGRLSEGEQQFVERSANLRICAHGPLTLEQSRSLQAGADGLLLYKAPGAGGMGGKYAEYVTSDRPIFYVGPEDSRSQIDQYARLWPLEMLAQTSRGMRDAPVREFGKCDAAKRLVDFLIEAEK